MDHLLEEYLEILEKFDNELILCYSKERREEIIKMHKIFRKRIIMLLLKDKE